MMHYTPTGETPRPSWCDAAEKALSQRWQVTRDLYARASDAAKPEIEAAWHDRLDRLYLNTAMPESSYRRFIRLADNFFIQE